MTLYDNGVAVGQQTATGSLLDFAIPGQLADGQYLFAAMAETVSGLTSPFSNPFTATVDNSPPAINSFTLDSAFQARPLGQGLTMLPSVRLDGQTLPGATVTLLQSGATATADSSGDFSFYPVSLPNLALTPSRSRPPMSQETQPHLPRLSAGSTIHSPRTCCLRM